MTFREKSAWVMMVLLIATGLLYGRAVFAMSAALGETAPPSIGLIIGITVLIVIGAIVGNTLAALTNPGEANAPEDERDKLVLSRAGNLSGLILAFGAVTGLWHFLAQRDANMLFHIVTASLVISQIAEYALTIFYYRRSWVV